MRRHAMVYVIALGSVCLIGCDDDDDDEPFGPATETFRATLNGANER